MSNITTKEAIKKHTVGPFAPGYHNLSQSHLSLFDKYWLGSRIVYQVSTAANLSKRFSLSEATFKKYAHAFKYGIMLHDKNGCPPTFDKVSQDSIKDITSRALSINAPEYLSHLRKEAELTATRRNKPIQAHTIPSRTTIWRAEKNLNVRTGVGEETTSARVAATRSIWNAVSFATMNGGMVPLAPPELICNIDATQFQVGGAANGKVQVKYSSDDGMRPSSLKSEPSKGNGGLVAYFIKYFLLIFADGTSGPPVFVFGQ